MLSAKRLAWRNRVISAVSVATCLTLARFVWSEADERAMAIYRITAVVGYGHLMGAAWPGLGSLRFLAAGDLVRISFMVSTCVTGLFLYAALLSQAPWLVLLLLAASVWHTVENDAELGQLYIRGGRPGPVSGAPGRVAAVVVGAAALVAVALASEQGPSFVGALAPAGAFPGPEPPASGPWIATSGVPPARLGGLPIQLADVFAGVTLYHLVSWLIVVGDRSRALRAAGDGTSASVLDRRVLTLHLLPAVPVAGGALFQLNLEQGWLGFLLSPAVYLFWSLLHVIQTVVRRQRRANETVGFSP